MQGAELAYNRGMYLVAAFGHCYSINQIYTKKLIWVSYNTYFSQFVAAQNMPLGDTELDAFKRSKKAEWNILKWFFINQNTNKDVLGISDY